VQVPDELAILGFDDLDFSEFIGLSTISQSLEMSGRQAVDLLSHAYTHYHRRNFVSRFCSVWEEVVPKRYIHQAKL